MSSLTPKDDGEIGAIFGGRGLRTTRFAPAVRCESYPAFAARGASSEDAGTLDHDVDALISPRQLSRVSFS